MVLSCAIVNRKKDMVYEPESCPLQTHNQLELSWPSQPLERRMMSLLSVSHLVTDAVLQPPRHTQTVALHKHFCRRMCDPATFITMTTNWRCQERALLVAEDHAATLAFCFMSHGTPCVCIIPSCQLKNQICFRNSVLDF